MKSKDAVSLCISKELRVLYAHYARLCLTLRYGMASEPTWEAVKFQNFLGKGCRETPRKASELCAEVCTNVVCSCCALSSTMSRLHHCLKTFCTRSIWLVLFRVIFKPLQEVEAIMGDGRIFDTGLFFTRLRCLVYGELSQHGTM